MDGWVKGHRVTLSLTGNKKDLFDSDDLQSPETQL